jgi:hypothetical protein
MQTRGVRIYSWFVLTTKGHGDPHNAAEGAGFSATVCKEKESSCAAINYKESSITSELFAAE